MFFFESPEININGKGNNGCSELLCSSIVLLFFLADRVAISDETTVGVAVSEFSRPLPHELRIRWSLMDGMWPVMGLDDSGFFRKKNMCDTSMVCICISYVSVFFPREHLIEGKFGEFFHVTFCSRAC